MQLYSCVFFVHDRSWCETKVICGTTGWGMDYYSINTEGNYFVLPRQKSFNCGRGEPQKAEAFISYLEERTVSKKM